MFSKFIQDSEPILLWEKGQLLTFKTKLLFCDQVAKQLFIEFEDAPPLIKSDRTYLMKLIYDSGIYFASGYLKKSDRTGQISFALNDDLFKFERRNEGRFLNHLAQNKLKIYFSLDEHKNKKFEIADQDDFYFHEFLKQYKIANSEEDVFFFNVQDISEGGASFIVPKGQFEVKKGLYINNLRIVFKNQEYLIEQAVITSFEEIKKEDTSGEKFLRVSLKFSKISVEQKNCLRDQVISEINYAKNKRK